MNQSLPVDASSSTMPVVKSAAHFQLNSFGHEIVKNSFQGISCLLAEHFPGSMKVCGNEARPGRYREKEEPAGRFGTREVERSQGLF